MEQLTLGDQVALEQKRQNFDTDFMKHPDRYGFCTFEQFRKNKTKWSSNPEQTLEVIAGAGTMFKGQIRKIRYELEGYACETLESVQSTARQMGFRDQDLTFFPVPYNHLAGKFDLLVRVFHKSTVDKRAEW